jgi:AbrB family looped-hinge helix DNA binding protein
MSLYIKKIGEKGEIVIPKIIRRQKGLEVNSKIEIIPTKNGILIMPIKKKFGELAGLFGKKGVKDIEELDAITHELLSGM